MQNKNNLIGVIDTTGNLVIPFKYVNFKPLDVVNDEFILLDRNLEWYKRTKENKDFEHLLKLDSSRAFTVEVPETIDNRPVRYVNMKEIGEEYVNEDFRINKNTLALDTLGNSLWFVLDVFAGKVGVYNQNTKSWLVNLEESLFSYVTIRDKALRPYLKWEYYYATRLINTIVVNQYVDFEKKITKSTAIKNGKIIATFPSLINITQTEYTLKVGMESDVYILSNLKPTFSNAKALVHIYYDVAEMYYGFAKTDGTTIVQPNEFDILYRANYGYLFFAKWVNEHLPQFSNSFKLYLCNKNKITNVTEYVEAGVRQEMEWSDKYNMVVRKTDGTTGILTSMGFQERDYSNPTITKNEETKPSPNTNTMSKDWMEATKGYLTSFESFKRACDNFTKSTSNSNKKELQYWLDYIYAKNNYIIAILNHPNDKSLTTEELSNYRAIANQKKRDLNNFQEQLNKGVYTALDALMYMLK